VTRRFGVAAFSVAAHTTLGICLGVLSVLSAERAEGLVVVEAIIDVRGRVASLRVLRPVPLLTEAALEAVRQWRYEPAWLNGQPVPVV
jgi:TonB family protein